MTVFNLIRQTISQETATKCKKDNVPKLVPHLSYKHNVYKHI